MIKLKKQEELVKTTDFHGLQLTIPSDHYWVAFNRDGDVFSFFREPFREGGVWNTAYEDNGRSLVGEVETDMDWKKSLVFVGR